FGAAKVGPLAFGPHDDAPEAVLAAGASRLPNNKWAILRGHIDASSMFKVAHLIPDDLVAFRLTETGTAVVVPCSTKRTPGFRRRPTLDALAAEQSFTGVITRPGSGLNRDGRVELDDTSFKVRGIFGSYCGAIGGCTGAPTVLLVGEKPHG